jgi:uncharacterized protein YciI
MNRTCIALALAVSSIFGGCNSTSSDTQARAYTLVFLKTGPLDDKLSKEEKGPLFAGHMSNMQRLANERHLLVAGPYGKNRHDKTLRGIFVLDTDDRGQAKAWAETDPTAKAGVFVLEYHELRTDAPLLAALERDLDRTAKAQAEGKPLNLGEGARSYVLLTAEHGDLARRELADLVAAKRVYLLADLDTTRAFGILDAKDLAAAQELLGGRADKLGSHTLDEWFASDCLEILAGG